jgi:metal-sulfur cluster biosynthetic enzyme
MNERFDYEGPAEWEPRISAALEREIDPEMALDIVNLGLVHAVYATPARVDVKLTMTSAACPVAELIIEEVRDALAGELGQAIEVGTELIWEPPWTPERMSERARSTMGWS